LALPLKGRRVHPLPLQATSTQDAGTQAEELPGAGSAAGGAPPARLHSRQSEAAPAAAWPSAGGAQPAAPDLPAAAAGALLATLSRIKAQLSSGGSALVALAVSRAASQQEPGWQMQMQRSRQGAYSLAEGNAADPWSGYSGGQRGYGSVGQSAWSLAGAEASAAAAAAGGTASGRLLQRLAGLKLRGRMVQHLQQLEPAPAAQGGSSSSQQPAAPLRQGSCLPFEEADQMLSALEDLLRRAGELQGIELALLQQRRQQQQQQAHSGGGSEPARQQEAAQQSLLARILARAGAAADR
jgi:hypothetical protein